MKTGPSHLLRLAACGASLLACSCSMSHITADSTPAKPAVEKPVKGSGTKTVSAKTSTADAVDAQDDYAAIEDHAFDPIEGFNRGTFWLNDKMYLVLFRPISKGYQVVFPKPVRKGITNAFENVKYPVRFVNCALQGKFKRAGQETGKFLVNTVAGVGGILNVSDKIPAIAHIPSEDTGQTLGAWGIGHGPYIVLPFFGPSSLRETVGMAGDYALNPVNWGIFWHGGHDWEHDWTIAPPSANTLRNMPEQFETYDTATKNAVDPYLSVRSIYLQNRADAVKK